MIRISLSKADTYISNVNKLMDDSHRVHDGRLTGWFKSRSPPGRKTIEDYHKISREYSEISVVREKLLYIVQH